MEDDKIGSKGAEWVGDFRKEVGRKIVRLEPGSKEGAISLAEHGIRSSVQAEMERLGSTFVALVISSDANRGGMERLGRQAELSCNNGPPDSLTGTRVTFQMMVFQWFNEDVNFRERNHVQLDIQQTLARNPVKIRGNVVKVTLEVSPDKRPWSTVQAIFLCAMRKFAGLRSETFDIRWVSTRIRVSMNSWPVGCMPVLSQLASITIGATWVPNRALSRCRRLWTMRDARKHEHQPRGSLGRRSLARSISIVKKVTGAVGGWTTCNTNTVFCTTFLVFTLCKRPTIG